MNEFIHHPQEQSAADSPAAAAQALQPALQFGERLELSGKHAEAEQFYRGLLIAHPRSTPLLHNLALLLRERGQADEAEALLRRAIAATPQDGAVRNTLGTVLHAAGRSDEAEAAYREAQRLEPGVEEYHYNLGALLEERERHAEALTEYQAALALEPRYARALVRIGAIRHKLGAEAEALADLDRAVAANPRYYDAHYYRGSVLSRLGRHDEALAELQSAAAIKPDSPEAVLATANTLRDAGRHEQAMSAYWHLLELQPERLETHIELNRLAWASGYHDLFLRSYAYARERLGPRPELLRSEAGFRLCRDDFTVAEELLWVARRLAPHDADLMGLLAQALAGQKRFEEANALYAGAAAADPANMRHRYMQAFALLQDRQPGDALEVLEEALTVNPQDQLVLAAQSLAYRELGDSRYQALVDPAYVKVYDLPPPSGFADAEAFNRVLAEELDRLHTMRVEPIDQTLRGGTQSPGYLFASRGPMLQELVQRVREAVADYIRGLPPLPSHPMSLRRQDAGGDVDFSGSWSCRLASRGYHSNHVHPMGWISSAYYVRLPQGMDDAQQRQGWLKFGESNLALGQLDRPDRHVEPKVGRLVLFPSYFWHGTVPFSDGGDRLTIAFDAVPKAASGVAA